MNTSNIRHEGYIRVCPAVFHTHLADPEANRREIQLLAERACKNGAKIMVTPELSLTGYSCGDLFRQEFLLKRAQEELLLLAQETAAMPMLIAVGVPLPTSKGLMNCAAILWKGEIAGIVPKSFLPEYNEFYEKRRFVSGRDVDIHSFNIGGKEIPFGTDLLFRLGEAVVGVEICEDLWMAVPPSSTLALKGANIILNLSASNELIGKHAYLLSLIRQQSARCLCGYVYSSAGKGESSTDVVYAGNAIVAENGKVLRESPRFAEMPLMETADIDLSLLRADRLNSSFPSQQHNETTVREILLESETTVYSDLRREVDPHPFVPATDEHLRQRCEEIISIQSAGLEQRLRHTHCRSLVVGISGGLDSTLALLIAVRAFDNLGLDRKGIVGITMPGFGTSKRTHTNADDLMKELGVTALEIPIGKAVEQHFEDIGQDPQVHDVTYENCQARERTQLLMDYANKSGGMVLGTGDLSELALGWCTYNGDHMSMYAVNASIPKTLVRHLVEYFAMDANDTHLRQTLLDIADTPISPELTPTDSKGDIAQKTEDLVGPYELHDFFIYNTLRHGFGPKRIFSLAQTAFRDAYTPQTIAHWLRVFYRRFFNQQFKRSCMPDGPKVGSVCLSPRGDWRMPSDASSQLWDHECEEIQNGLA